MKVHDQQVVGEGSGTSQDLKQAGGGVSLPAPLVERLATSSVALRQNWLFTSDGQAVKLGVQADEMEDAAILIADLLDAAQRVMATKKAWDDYARIGWPARSLLEPPNREAGNKAFADLAAAIAKALGPSAHDTSDAELGPGTTT